MRETNLKRLCGNRVLQNFIRTKVRDITSKTISQFLTGATHFTLVQPFAVFKISIRFEFEMIYYIILENL